MKVTITCYGTTEEYDRDEALREFTEGVLYCDGSERDRYCSIVSGLRAGLTVVDDEWAWAN